MNSSGKWPYLCIFAVLAGFFLATWANEDSQPAIIQSPANYLFEPERGCEPYLPGEPEPVRTKDISDCSSPYRTNPGFVTLADVKAGDTVCVHYTTLPGGPRAITYQLTEGPFPDDSQYNFGPWFNADPQPFPGYSKLNASDVGLTQSVANHPQVFRGWTQEAFTSAGPCQPGR